MTFFNPPPAAYDFFIQRAVEEITHAKQCDFLPAYVGAVSNALPPGETKKFIYQNKQPLNAIQARNMLTLFTYRCDDSKSFSGFVPVTTERQQDAQSGALAGWGGLGLALTIGALATVVETNWHPVAYTWDWLQDTSHKEVASTRLDFEMQSIAHHRQVESKENLIRLFENPPHFSIEEPRQRPAGECDNPSVTPLTDIHGTFVENPISLFGAIQNNEHSRPYIEAYLPNEIILLPEPVTIYLKNSEGLTEPITFRQVSITYALSFLNIEEQNATNISPNIKDFPDELHYVILAETIDCQIIGVSYGTINQEAFEDGKKHPVLSAIRTVKLDPKEVYYLSNRKHDIETSTIRLPVTNIHRLALANYIVRLLSVHYHQYLSAFDANTDFDHNKNRTIINLIRDDLLQSFRDRLPLDKRFLEKRCWNRETLVATGRPEDDVTICELRHSLNKLAGFTIVGR